MPPYGIIVGTITFLSTALDGQMLTISNADMKSYYRVYPPRLIFDGYTESFALSRHEMDGMWARVDLERYSHITKIEINNVGSDQCCQQRLVGASVYINLDGWNVKSCGKITSIRSVYVFYCAGAGTSIEMRQEGEVRQWNIAEIRVYGTVIDDETGTEDGAETESSDKNKQGGQMLEIYDANIRRYQPNFPPSKMHDGSTDTYATVSYLTNGMWARVNLVYRSHITKVEIYNGWPYQSSQVRFSVYIKSGDNDVKRCGTFSEFLDKYVMNCVGDGDSIEMREEGGFIWHIAEIRVYGSISQPVFSLGNQVEVSRHGSLLHFQGKPVCVDYFDDTAAHAICKNMSFTRAGMWYTDEHLSNSDSSYNELDLGEVRCEYPDWESCNFSKHQVCSGGGYVFLTCHKDCYTDYANDIGWFPESAIIERRNNNVSESACLGFCNRFENCSAAVLLSSKFGNRECVIVSTQDVTRRVGWSTAIRNGTCPDPKVPFQLIDERNGVTLNSGLLLYNNGTVCDDGQRFTTNNAIAICTEMGYLDTTKNNVSWRYRLGSYKWRNLREYKISMGRPVCRNTNWSDCTFSTSLVCSHWYDIILNCSRDDFFTIVDDNRNPGLLLYRGGSICPDVFDENVARAICSLLGFNENKYSWSSGYIQGFQNSYPRKVSYIHCKGYGWDTCSHDGNYERDEAEVTCETDKSVFLSCNARDTLAPGYIVLVVATVLVVVILIGIVYFVRIHRRKATTRQNEREEINSFNNEEHPCRSAVSNSVELVASIRETNLDEPTPALGRDNRPPPRYEESTIQFEEGWRDQPSGRIISAAPHNEDTLPSYDEVMADSLNSKWV